jgi:uncharacterized damage-inducible protein DinB
MKEYFLNLFAYDNWANKVILETITQAHEPQAPVKLMAHLLAAQQIWINRCKGLPPPGIVLWPDWQIGTFESLINDNQGAWVSYLNELQPGNFEKIISYKNMRGENWENKLSDILAHVINHGTHHRAQIGQQLKLAGVENLPTTDYIFYVRSK